ncbi:steroid 17alpha-monooxygenase or 17alpha-hydroxyprogesterone aldolase [Spatholobus suberectus]|nr:steroid 17alpha-monooxygenase or 17alpha-hydroxyprogesterone aldolase [Spatholobus suberectus]
MGLWFYILASISICIFLQSLFIVIRNKRLPPSPPTIPILGNIFWLLKSSNNFADLEPVLRSLRSKYGNIVTIHIGSMPSIFITCHEAAHRALVKNGTVFAGRPLSLQTTQVFFPNQYTVTTSPYGPNWRMLRQNLMQVIQPSRLSLYSHCRKWALNILKKHIIDNIESDNKAIPINDHFNYTLYVLFSYICFGEKFDEKTVKSIQRVQHSFIHNFIRFNVLNFVPFLSKIVFRRLWREILEIRQNQVNVFLPIIKARREKIKNKVGIKDENEEEFKPYVDTLFDMKLPSNGSKITDEELVSMCSEFMLGGTDTTVTTWLWTMANLVKYQNIQEKLFDEIKEVVKPDEDIEEEHLKRMPYLKAVVLETLRRHPPGHFILPRAVTHDTVMDGHDIPKNAIVNFLVAEFGWDPNVWEDPMEFKPERFLRHDEGDAKFDLKGTLEIKMMPFGAGRRVCPAISMATLHLEYFVANLVRDFKWALEDGCEVDMSEKQAFTIVMKNPLRPCASPRITS